MKQGPAFYDTGFDGAETYEEERDGKRLGAQLERVKALMLVNGYPTGYHTLRDIAYRTCGSEASVSARLRDLRKKKYGGYTVLRRYEADGLWSYRVSKP